MENFMVHYSKFFQRLLIIFAPIVSIQTIVLLPVRADEPVINLDTLDFTSTATAKSDAISLPVTPGKIFSFNSSGLLAIDSLNKQPDALDIVTNANAIARATDNAWASAAAKGDIRFLSEPTFTAPLNCNFGNISIPLTTTASCNQSISQLEAQGDDFSAFVDSNSEIQGEFLVGAGETFSFNFLAYLGLDSNADSSLKRQFYTTGEVSFNLFDFDSGSILDSFLLSANLDTHGSEDFLIKPQANNNLQFNETYAPSFNTNKGAESAFAVIEGNYSRQFDKQTRLVLVGTNTNTIKATPEASNIVAMLFFFGVLASLGKKNRLEAKN
ncbi:MAG: hypothetical protein ACRC11_10595 [Xenococcaceae cyanobacterium]